MTDWHLLELADWNAALLRHFFGRGAHLERPVSSLNVCADTLALAVSAPRGEADEVRAAFVKTVLATGRRNDFLEAATDYDGFPGPPLREDPPRFVGALLMTCLAASESTEELQNEGSFVQRLRDFSGQARVEVSRRHLPTLWHALRSYLERNSRRFRGLVLPDPKGLTLIGHTVKLAFPDRRDQRELSALLDESGLAGEEPQFGHALTVVNRFAARFRPAFQEAVRDFHRLYARVVQHEATVEELGDHRVWNAIRDAALRGRGVELDADAPATSELQLLADAQDERLTLFLVSPAPLAEKYGVESNELPTPYGRWRFAGVCPPGDLDVGARLAVGRLLARQLRDPAFDRAVSAGVLLFAEEQHGLLELVDSEKVTEASVGLVRRDVLPALKLLDGFKRATSAESAYPGWIQIFDIRPQRLSSTVLDGTPFSRFWHLHATVPRTTVRVVRGVRIERGWLGYREVLPTIEVPAGSAVELEREGGTERIPCRATDPGCWELPNKDLEGDWRAVATTSTGRTASQLISFFALPTGEAYVLPSAPTTFLVESVAGTRTLDRVDAEPVALRPGLLAPMLSASDFAKPRTYVARTLPPGRSTLGEKLGVGVHVRRRAPTIDELSERAKRLVAILAASANRRAGLPYGDWSQLVARIFRLSDALLVERVTRAWQEHGFLDVAYSTRWRSRTIVARPPSLVVHERGDAICLVAMGLCLPSTLANLSDLALSKESGRGVSPFVPAPAKFKLGDAAELQALTDLLGIPTRRAPTVYQGAEAVPGEPPVAYQCLSSEANWSLLGCSPAGDASVSRWVRPDRPDYWVVSQKQRRFWSYSKNAIALAVCALTGTAGLDKLGKTELQARHAFLPLPIARAAVSLGSLSVGPEPGDPSEYIYDFDSAVLRDEIEELTRTPRLLAAGTSKSPQVAVRR